MTIPSFIAGGLNGVQYGVVTSKDLSDRQQRISFSPPALAPPQVALGIASISLGHATNPRIQVVANKIDETAFTFNANPWYVATGPQDTVLNNCSASYLEVPLGSQDVQCGELQVTANSGATVTALRTNFARSYATPPTVVVWIKGFDFNIGKNFRLRSYADGIDNTGFTLHVESWMDTQLNFATLTWIAYTTGMAGVQSGTNMNPPTSNALFKTSDTITFPTGAFNAAPTVLVALGSMDMDSTGDIILSTAISNVSQTGFTYTISSGATAKMLNAGIRWLALA